MIKQLMVTDFAVWRDNAQCALDGAMPALLPVVLDVREPHELQVASVQPDGFELVHIAMGTIPAHVAQLKARFGADHPIACLCHHGMRSLQVANYLTQSGFNDVVNLQGGIDAWSRQVDSSVPVY